jgi:N-methylhydantoinase B
VLESHYPVLFEEAALREDSAGAGQFRGGFGIQYRVKLRRGEASAAFMMEHGRFPPYALEGGKTGAMTEIRVSQGGRVTSPPHVSKGTGYTLAPGDWVDVKTPGGGGWGDPLLREPERVSRDVRRGYITPEVAAQVYGHAETEAAPGTRSDEPAKIS